MGSTGPATVIIPIDLGTVSAFDQNVFPLAYYENGGDNLSKGRFLIKATLQEMKRIRDMGINLNNNDKFIYSTRSKVEALRVQEAKLQNSRKTLNPIKALLNYRAARLFHTASRALYLNTVRTSEKIQREEQHMQVVSDAKIQIVNEAVSPDVVIGGWAIELPDGLTDNARQTIINATETIATTDPFQDDFLISQLRDGEQEITLAGTASLLSQDDSGPEDDGGNKVPTTSSSPPAPSRPTSPPTIIHITNSIVATNSTFSGLTVNRNSQNSSGASLTQGFSS